jgi:hypothetical protein
MASDEGDALVNNLAEALDLAKAACHLDNLNNVLGACDYYDKSILIIDEVLSKIPASNVQYTALAEIRNKYDDRLEYLRAVESSKYDLSSPPPKQTTFSSNRRKRQCHVVFEEDEQLLSAISDGGSGLFCGLQESPPSNSLQLPYWQMRMITRTIENGGFLTPAVYIPKNVWTQLGVKFSGLSAKTLAFQGIVSVLINYIFEISIPPNTAEQEAPPLKDITIHQILTSMRSCREELHKLQNQLSKPFPYIRELGPEDHGQPKRQVTMKSNGI